MPTVAARELAADPTGKITAVMAKATDVSRRSGSYGASYSYGMSYAYGTSNPRIEMAAAVLAIADGSAARFEDLTELVELTMSARERRDRDGYGYDDEYPWPPPPGESTRAAVISAAVDALVEGFSILSAPAAFGEITQAMRAVARAMLL